MLQKYLFILLVAIGLFLTPTVHADTDLELETAIRACYGAGWKEGCFGTSCIAWSCEEYMSRSTACFDRTLTPTTWQCSSDLASCAAGFAGTAYGYLNDDNSGHLNCRSYYDDFQHRDEYNNVLGGIAQLYYAKNGVTPSLTPPPSPTPTLGTGKIQIGIFQADSCKWSDFEKAYMALDANNDFWRCGQTVDYYRNNYTADQLPSVVDQCWSDQWVTLITAYETACPEEASALTTVDLLDNKYPTFAHTAQEKNREVGLITDENVTVALPTNNTVDEGPFAGSNLEFNILGYDCGLGDSNDPELQKCCVPIKGSVKINVPVVGVNVAAPVEGLVNIFLDIVIGITKVIANTQEDIMHLVDNDATPYCIVGNPTADPYTDSCNCEVPKKGGTTFEKKAKELCNSIITLAEKTKCGECFDGQTLKEGTTPHAGIWTGFGCMSTNLSIFVERNVFGPILGIAGMISLACIIYAAFLIQTSQGNPEQITKAQELLTSCIMGLIMIIFSIFILRLIGVDILRLPSFGG